MQRWQRHLRRRRRHLRKRNERIAERGDVFYQLRPHACVGLHSVLIPGTLRADEPSEPGALCCTFCKETLILFHQHVHQRRLLGTLIFSRVWLEQRQSDGWEDAQSPGNLDSLSMPRLSCAGVNWGWSVQHESSSKPNIFVQSTLCATVAPSLPREWHGADLSEPHHSNGVSH